LTTTDAARARDELRGSADAIERALGRRPGVFAYPFGGLNREIAALAATEFRWSCTTEFAAVGAAVLHERVPRLDAYYFQRGEVLETFGSPAFARFVRRRHWLRQIRQWIVR